MAWKKLPLPTSENITGISFPDDDLGYLVTDAGSILKTTDGGATFTILDYKAGTELEDACFLDDDFGFIFGRHGFLAGTIDGGQTWELLPQDSSYWFRDMAFLGDDHGFLTGVIESADLDLVGFIGESTDEGLTWSFDTTQYRGLSRIDVLEDDNVWIAAVGNIIYSTDRGQTWLHNSTGNRSDEVTDLFFPNIRYGWCVGRGGLLLYTDDGGWSWDRKDKLTQSDLNCLTAPEMTHVYIAGEHFIAGTKTAGRAWDVDSLSYKTTFNDFDWTGDEIYLCGSRGTLLRLVE